MSNHEDDLPQPSHEAFDMIMQTEFDAAEYDFIEDVDRFRSTGLTLIEQARMLLLSSREDVSLKPAAARMMELVDDLSRAFEDVLRGLYLTQSDENMIDAVADLHIADESRRYEQFQQVLSNQPLLLHTKDEIVILFERLAEESSNGNEFIDKVVRFYRSALMIGVKAVVSSAESR